MIKILFLCGRNRFRSPTAENIFSNHPGLEVASAGLSPDAESPVTSEILHWADVIFVMEKKHRTKLAREFSIHLRDKRVICLNIPDKYGYMDEELIRILKEKIEPLIQRM